MILQGPILLKSSMLSLKSLIMNFFINGEDLFMKAFVEIFVSVVHAANAKQKVRNDVQFHTLRLLENLEPAP